MNLNNLFSTKERIKILNKIIYNKNLLSVNKIAKELDLSKGLISKFFDILTKEDILTNAGNAGNKFMVLDNLHTRGIKVILNINKIDPSIFKRYSFVEKVGLYGSFARGTNDEESDMAIWVKIRKTKDNEIAELESELRTKYERIKLLFTTTAKLSIMKEKDPVFHHSLLFGSIIIYS